ncbi:Slit-like protein 2 protein [Aphelenchoides besseyi]|nr:Slit-like protein 2 protein [Aphelenchoides besseyi]
MSSSAVKCAKFNCNIMSESVVFYLPIFLLLLFDLSTAVSCPHKCLCSHLNVICTGQSLTQIPSGIPSDSIRLDLQENQISVIRKDDLNNLPNLRVLQLMDNELSVIEPGAFNNLTKLERIRLNRNFLRSLPENLFLHNRKLHRIDLSENQLTLLNDEHLHGPQNLRNLQLDRNQLTCLDTTIINSWPELEILTLNGNNLNTIARIDNLKNLRVFRLMDNPWLCDCRIQWIKSIGPMISPNVRCNRPGMLQGRSIEAVDIENMKCSGIEKRAATSCREASICPSVCTCTDTTVDCRDRGLKFIPANLPTSTTELRLEQNHISMIPSRAFRNLKNLRRLDMSKNNIRSIARDAFDGLSALNTLVLYANNLTDLPPEIFSSLSELQLLLLNANGLKCLRRGVFQGLKKLNLLSLYDNNIQSITNGTFDPLANLQTLHLARNPLICDCNLEWLAELLERRPLETSGAKCALPRRLANRRLALLEPNKFRCKGSEIYVTKGAGECIIDNSCPASCICHRTVVDCSDRRLTQIPSHIPQFTTELRLNRNRLSSVGVMDGLRHLTKLERLDLSENLIENVETNALHGLHSLRELNLSSNRLRRFSSDAFGFPASTLEVLLLNDNLLQCITPTTMSNFVKLRKLSLARNQLRSITNDIFDLSSNLNELRIEGNEFLCNCQLQSLVVRMHSPSSVITFDQPTCHEPISLKGQLLSSLNSTSLLCNGEEEQVCAENGNYCPAHCTCDDTVVRCSNRQLKHFPIGISEDTTELYLDNNEIQTIPLSQLNKLRNLVKIDLSQNQLTTIETDSFVGLNKLSTLILSYNNIRCLEDFAFRGLVNLRILSLHKNLVSVLPENAFLDLVNISHIAVGSNELYCDSNMIWFSKWIKARFIEPGIARCHQPSILKNKLLLTSNHQKFPSGKIPKEVLSKCNACIVSPCKNNGTCVREAGHHFTCNCNFGFYGKLCERKIDACYGSPCLNNGTCKVIEEGRFECQCPLGFKGERCEENIDDCIKNSCQNGARCVDQNIQGKFCETRLNYCTELNPCKNGAKCVPLNNAMNYSCNCPAEFFGRDCEQKIEFVAESAEMFMDHVQSCSSLNCHNGKCEQNDKDELECRCFEGFFGPSCNILKSMSFAYSSFLALSSWNLRPSGNLSLILRTTERSGILAYFGDKSSHFAAELFDSRIKISFFVGNSPSSHLYSYRTVSDGLSHKLDFNITGNAIRLAIDQNTPQTITNYGNNSNFKLSSQQHLYLGGFPTEIGNLASNNFHVKSTTGLKGCISDVRVNGYAVDLLADSVQRQNVTSGCSNVVDLCTEVKCQNDGQCALNSSQHEGWQCNCKKGFNGRLCEDQEIRCVKEKFHEYVEENGCRSLDKVKNAKCLGYCGNTTLENGCCGAVRIKKRKVKLHCVDGSQKSKIVDIIRKCQCTNMCPKVY